MSEKHQTVLIAVLITVHNRKEKTLTCLEKLFAQTGYGFAFDLSVYLVDDASSDGTKEDVKHSFPTVNIIPGNGTLYWNRGMHTAWKAAAERKHDYYLWLNNDTFLYEDGLLEMLFSSKQTDSTAIICGSIESALHKGKLSYGGVRLKKGKYSVNYPNGHLQPCDIINGNSVLVPAGVYSIIGNLDWTFRHAIGDNDYSLRAKSKGVTTFTTRRFIASCERDNSLPRWCLPEVRLQERIANLYSPLGNSQPRAYFKYVHRHFGLPAALRSFILMHVRLLFPLLWNKAYKWRTCIITNE